MLHAIVDVAPTDSFVTSYDRAHLATYLRLLDAAAGRTAWEESARILLGIDASVEPDRARRRYDSHLARARWIADQGYRHYVGGPRNGQ